MLNKLFGVAVVDRIEFAPTTLERAMEQIDQWEKENPDCHEIQMRCTQRPDGKYDASIVYTRDR